MEPVTWGSVVKGIRLVHVITVDQSLLFLREQIRFIRERGFEVTVVCSPSERLLAFSEEEGVPVVPIEMPRRISPIDDLEALRQLVVTLRRLKPDIVHSHTPKGGLLGTIAGALAGVSVRIYHMRGLPMVTAEGWRRVLLATTERVSCGLATKVLCVSHSLRNVALAERLVNAEKIEVLLGGSGQGVDADGRFNPANLPEGTRKDVRASLGIPDDATLIGFVGRLVRDKGIVELSEAWRSLREDHPDAHLTIVGPWEPRDPVPKEVRRSLESDPRVHLTGRCDDTERLYAAMDVVTLPSYREGFPNVPLEAAAMGLPVVATRVPGCIDAVEDGVTGTLVPVGDADALADALSRYLTDRQARERHGLAGRDRVLSEFRRESIFAAMTALYASFSVAA